MHLDSEARRYADYLLASACRAVFTGPDAAKAAFAVGEGEPFPTPQPDGALLPLIFPALARCFRTTILSHTSIPARGRRRARRGRI